MHGRTILVVDDEPEIREILRETLELRGATVLEASHGKEAFEKIQQGGVDLVLSDMRMPRFDGVYLLKAIQAMPQGRPLICFMSGFSDLPFSEAVRLGALKVFEKPFDFPSLLSAVEEFLSKA